MRHVYKIGGPWKAGNVDYTIKAVNNEFVESYLAKGWALSLDDLCSDDGELTSAEIKAICDDRGIKYDGRWGRGKLLAALEF